MFLLMYICVNVLIGKLNYSDVIIIQVFKGYSVSILLY